MEYAPPRSEGFDYSKPDEESLRCQRCNPDGMNRTGLVPIRYIGTSTTFVAVVSCTNRLCKNGLIGV